MRSKNTALRILIIALAVIIITLLSAYLLGRSYFAEHFYANTKINGYDMGNLTEQEAVRKLSGFVSDYIIDIETYQGDTGRIIGPDFDYNYYDDKSIAALLDEEQNENLWFAEFNGEYSYEVPEEATLDEVKLKKAFYALDMADKDSMRKPVDAHIGKNEDTGLYELVPEDDGNVLHLKAAYKTLKKAVYAHEEKVYLDESYFDHAKVTTSDDELVACMANLSAYFGTSIEYLIGDEREILDNATIQSWLDVDEDFNVSVDEEKVEKYAQYLATKYNTYGDKREFKTSIGDTIEIGGGDYGWVVNKPKEKEQILEDIKKGGKIEREMIYEQRAKVPGFDDIGDTYIEVDYTNQHLYYYVEGELKYETDVVTGNLNKGNGSPDGVFKIVYKEKDAILVGEGYSSPVKYFMPFAYNVGIHDASWRSSFGGQIYLSNGSHGCVNAPYKAAEDLFGMVEIGTPVVAYYREEVVLTAENAGYSNAYSYVSPEKLEEMKKAEEERAAAEAAAALNPDGEIRFDDV